MSRSRAILALEEETAALPNANRAVARAWTRLARVVQARAQRIASAPDDQDDLVQEALIELWKMDPTRYDPTCKDDMRYLARALRYRMIEVYGSRAADVDQPVECVVVQDEAQPEDRELSVERVSRQLRLVR